MAYSFTKEQLSDFDKKINFDVTGFFRKYHTFVDDHYSQMTAYYNGETSNLSPDATNLLIEITKISKRVEAQMMLRYRNLDKLYLYRIVEFTDDIIVKIQVFNKLSKFLKSAVFDVLEENSVGANQIMQDNETFERISGRRSFDPQNDWADIVVRNRISELDYNAQEGGLTYVLGGRDQKNLSIDGVVDNLTGQKIYGLDIKDTFEFVDDDFKVLSYIDTFVQSIKNLAQLKRTDLFFLPDVGIPKSLLGNDLGTLSLPFIAYELKRVFAIDDSIHSFTVTKFEVVGTTFYFDFVARSYYDFVTEERAKLNN